jgi:hypothetical protein
VKQVAGAVVAAALAATLFAVVARDGGAAAPDAVDGVPSAYTITYETTAAGVTSTEARTVHRPFLSRVDVGDTSRVTDAGVLATSSPGAPWVRIAVPIAPAGGDLRPDAVLDDAIEAGLVEVHGRDEVLGRSCRVIELGGPVSGGTLTPIGAVAGESAEVCIDDAGLVLRETWTVDGVVQRARRAVRVEIGDVDDDVFTVPEVARQLGFGDGGGSVRSVAADEDPGFAETWRATVPDGFRHTGRYLVLPPAVGTPVDPTMPRAADIALVTDVWTDGVDVLLLDQGAATGAAARPWDERPYTEPVSLGALGRGVVVFDLRLNEVRVDRPDGGFVRLAGTLPPGRLVQLARQLVLEDRDA